jgi:hypothetical protein
MRISPDALIQQVADARERTLELVGDLTYPQVLAPRLAIVNLLL